jgi:hypothetical protein
MEMGPLERLRNEALASRYEDLQYVAPPVSTGRVTNHRQTLPTPTTTQTYPTRSFAVAWYNPDG